MGHVRAALIFLSLSTHTSLPSRLLTLTPLLHCHQRKQPPANTSPLPPPPPERPPQNHFRVAYRKELPEVAARVLRYAVDNTAVSGTVHLSDFIVFVQRFGPLEVCVKKAAHS